MTTRFERITTLLQDTLQPTRLELVDDSARHAGHVGAAPGGETHYILTIESKHFKGLSRVQQHQLIYKALSQELQSGLHAISINALFTE